MIILDSEQGTFEWLEEKIGVAGGTRIASIITPKQLKLSASKNDLILKLVDENITGLSAEKSFSSDATDRGSEFEPDARIAYRKKTGIEILQFGLCLSESNKHHGLSPDGFTEDFTGAIEIKCPGFKHLKYINNEKYPDVTIYSDYKPQCINYFIVNPKLQWLDTVSFRPEFYPKPLHIERIRREDIQEDITKVEIAICEFFEEYNIEFNKYTF